MKLNKYLKIKFVISFIISYILLIILLNPIGQKLVLFQKDLIYLLFGDYLNYQNFVFVPFCSGLISLSVYFSVIIGLKIIKIKTKNSIIFLSIASLLLINILRLILILVIEKISNSILLTEITHIFSWFFMAVIILLLIKKTV